MTVQYDDILYNEVMGSIVPNSTLKPLIHLPLPMLQALSANAKLLREIDGSDEIITPELLDNLVIYAVKQQADWGDRFSLVKHKHFSNACGCLGAQDGDLECPCVMSRYLEMFKYDIAIRHLELQTQGV